MVEGNSSHKVFVLEVRYLSESVDNSICIVQVLEFVFGRENLIVSNIRDTAAVCTTDWQCACGLR